MATSKTTKSQSKPLIVAIDTSAFSSESRVATASRAKPLPPPVDVFLFLDATQAALDSVNRQLKDITNKWMVFNDHPGCLALQPCLVSETDTLSRFQQFKKIKDAIATQERSFVFAENEARAMRVQFDLLVKTTKVLNAAQVCETAAVIDREREIR